MTCYARLQNYHKVIYDTTPILYSTSYTILHCTTLYHTVKGYTTECNTVPYCILLCYTILHYRVHNNWKNLNRAYHVTPYYTALHKSCTTKLLHYTILCCSVVIQRHRGTLGYQSMVRLANSSSSHAINFPCW